MINGVTNPSSASASDTVSVFTTSDTTPVTSGGYAVVAAHQISQPTVTLSNLAPSATNVSYTVAFGTSATGGLLGAASSQIKITFPSGTGLGTVVSSTVTDTTSGVRVGNCPSLSGVTATCVIFNSDTVAAGDAVQVAINGITNPSTAPASESLSASTTSDTAAVTSAHYTAANAPTVTSISPTSGPAAGGTTVTINGSNFTGASAVKFGATAAASFSFVSPSKITATSPAGSSTVDITVTTAGGTSATSNADRFTYTASPPPGDQPISATGGFTFNGNAPASINGTVATFVDPDRAATASEYSASVDWGDGMFTLAASITGGSGSFTVSAGHTYSAAGTFTIKVTINDIDNVANSQTVTDSARIVGNGPIVVTSTPLVDSSSAAGFAGSVNPQGLNTTVHFEYGLDAMYRAAGKGILYDQRTPDQSIGAGFSPQPVSAKATGLVPNALYHVRLVAVNNDGTTDGPDRTFTTQADPKPPAPVLGRAVNVALVSGVVFIKPPPGKSLRAAGFTTSAIKKGQGFLPLTEARQIPSGSQVDARRGTLTLTTSTGTHGKTQTGTFSTGLFKLTQDRNRLHKGLTSLTLLEGTFPGSPSFASCKAHGAADATGAPLAGVARLSSRVLNILRARDQHGRFRTRGRYSAGTVRGTQWDTIDRCDGTLTVVHRGSVQVQDFHRHRAILVRAGHSYLAKALARRRG